MTPLIAGVLQPRPLHTSNNVEATLSNATGRMILSTKSNVALTSRPFSATMSNQISCFRQSQNKLNSCSVCFNFVERTKFHEKLFTLLSKTATVSKQHSRAMFYDKLVRPCCRFGMQQCCRFWQQSNVASTKSSVASPFSLV